MNPELRDRVLLPFAIPVGAMALIAVFVFAFSRILLVVGKEMAVVVATAAALDILVVCSILAYRPPTPATYRLAAVTAVATLLAGAVALNVVGFRGERTEPAHEAAAAPAGGEAVPAAPAAIEVVAKDLKFATETINVAAGEQVRITLRNQDAATLHNVSVYVDDSLEQDVFKGELFPGVATKTYTFDAPAAGSYYFQCDVHPTTMTGTLTVA